MSSGGGSDKSGSAGGGGAVKTPSDFLKSIRGRPVVIKLNSGVDYRGILACLDGYMNIAMEQTEEYVNGQLKNKYGDAFIKETMFYTSVRPSGPSQMVHETVTELASSTSVLQHDWLGANPK